MSNFTQLRELQRLLNLSRVQVAALRSLLKPKQEKLAREKVDEFRVRFRETKQNLAISRNSDAKASQNSTRDSSVSYKTVLVNNDGVLSTVQIAMR